MTSSKRKQAQARAQQAEKKKKWRTDLPQVQSEHLISLWLAYNRGIKGAPKEAQDANQPWGYYYSGKHLFYGEETLIAEQRTFKGKPHYIALVRPMSAPYALRQLCASVVRNGPIVYVQNNMLDPGSTVRVLRTFSRYQYRVDHDPSIRAERQRATDKEARRFIFYNKPIAVKHRAEYQRLRSAYNAAYHEQSNIDYRLAPTNDEVLHLLGHTHVEGMMYKRLSKVHVPYVPALDKSTSTSTLETARQQYQSKENRFVWPPIGVWTHPVDDVQICRRGYHLCPKHAIGQWADHGGHLFLAEGDAAGESQSDKTVYARARLVKYIGDIGSITRDEVAALRKVNLPALKKAMYDAKAAMEAYYQKHKKYL